MKIPEGHRKRVRHFHEAGHCHELTFSCYRRMPLLTNNVWRGLVREAARRRWSSCHFYSSEGVLQADPPLAGGVLGQVIGAKG